MRHKEYVNVLFDRGLVRHRMKNIQSKFHKIGTYDVRKISLSCFNDRHYILDDGINSLAHFHENVLG